MTRDAITTDPSATRDTLDVAAEDGTRVHLAPIAGRDIRRDLGPEYFLKRPALFTAKLLGALVPIAGSWAAVGKSRNPYVRGASVLVNGFMYAHLVELQHECLHEHAYRKRGQNRAAGVLSGSFMLSSYWHYKHDHLLHHAFLGTPQNREFFNYRFEGLDSAGGMLRACFHLGRYRDVARDMGRALRGKGPAYVTKTIAAKKIRQEYQFLAALVAGATAISVWKRTPYLLWTWLIPTLAVAEPTHFLIELPEHFGLNTQTNPDVLTNTRTVRASPLAAWFTNRNDLHTAHHFHQGVPMVNVPALHELIKDDVQEYESSYPHFYQRVLHGDLRFQGDDQTCMTR